jgi:CRP/FNR family transcriptional activator FtrB
VSEAEPGPARFVLPFEKRLLAARIGCSQENLSRAFAALRRIGVETQRGVVVIRHLTALRAFAAQSAPEHA